MCINWLHYLGNTSSVCSLWFHEHDIAREIRKFLHRWSKYHNLTFRIWFSRHLVIFGDYWQSQLVHYTLLLEDFDRISVLINNIIRDVIMYPYRYRHKCYRGSINIAQYTYRTSSSSYDLKNIRYCKNPSWLGANRQTVQGLHIISSKFRLRQVYLGFFKIIMPIV